MLSNFWNLVVGALILFLAAFGALQWLHAPIGSFVDWAIGLATFCWLLTIATVPWNIHFKAKEVLAESELSSERHIAVDDKKIAYVRMLAGRSLLVAIALHLISAIALYTLAFMGISAIGYIGSIAALLLTILRPSVRAYEYLARRLQAISQEFICPREDAVELRNRLAALQVTVDTLERQLRPDDPYSWVARQQQLGEETRKELANLTAAIAELRAGNALDHDRLSRESQQAIAQLSADSQFLDRVRDLIRFFKEA